MRCYIVSYEFKQPRAAYIRDRIWEFLDPDDGMESSREAAWQDVRCENQWLRDNL